jgi:hypothetical protein
LHISTFCVAATVGVCCIAFFKTRTLLLVATCTTLARRQRGGLEITETRIGLDKRRLKEEGLVRMMPSSNPTGSTHWRVLTPVSSLRSWTGLKEA